MSDAVMQVELVAADRLVWSGQATMVIARTTEGDVGILPNHAPMLSSIIEGVVDVQTVEGETWVAAVDAGFLSVADTIEAFNKIADGEYDHVAEQAFFMCGGLDDVERKWAEIQKGL